MYKVSKVTTLSLFYFFDHFQTNFSLTKCQDFLLHDKNVETLMPALNADYKNSISS